MKELRRRNGWGGARGGSGRKKAAERCPCGEMTKARATKRNHDCMGPLPPKRKKAQNAR